MAVLKDKPDVGLAGSILDSYPGSKGGSGVAERIIRQMPPHDLYIEGFAGAAAIFRKKRLSQRSVLVDCCPNVCEALRGFTVGYTGVEVVNHSFLDWMASYRWSVSASNLVYLDPPYLRSVRTRLLYDFEFASEPEHIALIELARALPCYVMLSGYRSALYKRLLGDWRSFEVPTMSRGGKRIEIVWCNFDEPELLHDERFAGAGYRERENLSRKRKRWQAKFFAMARPERQAVAAALAMCDREALEAALIGLASSRSSK